MLRLINNKYNLLIRYFNTFWFEKGKIISVPKGTSPTLLNSESTFFPVFTLVLVFYI